MKEFNTTAVCIPSKYYMVDISERVKKIIRRHYSVRGGVEEKWQHM